MVAKKDMWTKIHEMNRLSKENEVPDTIEFIRVLLKQLLINTQNQLILRRLVFQPSFETLSDALYEIFLQSYDSEDFEYRSEKAYLYACYSQKLAILARIKEDEPDKFNSLIKEVSSLVNETFKNYRCVDTNSVSVDELMLDEDFMANLEHAKSIKERWEIIDATTVIPAFYLSLTESGTGFLKSKTERNIRKIFGYGYSTVPDLTELGFVKSEEAIVYYLCKNKKTGAHFIVDEKSFEWKRNKTEIAKSKDGKWLSPKEVVTIKVSYRPVIGIDVEKHTRFVEEYNRRAKVRYAEAHKVKHKPHKPHKPQKVRECNTVMDIDGELLNAKGYSVKYQVSLATAYRVIRNLNG